MAEPKDVEDLADSFMAFQSVHSTSMFVVFWPQTEHLPRRDVPFNLHDPASLAKCRKGGFFLNYHWGPHTASTETAYSSIPEKSPLSDSDWATAHRSQKHSDDTAIEELGYY